MQSALEQECLRKLSELKAAISSHDRGVLLGFFLGLFPLFPVAFFGFLITTLNYRLWKAGKLDVFESGLIRKGLVIGLANSLLGLVALAALAKLLFGVAWLEYPGWIGERLFWFLHWLHGYWHSVREAVYV